MCLTGYTTGLRGARVFPAGLSSQAVQTTSCLTATRIPESCAHFPRGTVPRCPLHSPAHWGLPAWAGTSSPTCSTGPPVIGQLQHLMGLSSFPGTFLSRNLCSTSVTHYSILTNFLWTHRVAAACLPSHTRPLTRGSRPHPTFSFPARLGALQAPPGSGQ